MNVEEVPQVEARPEETKPLDRITAIQTVIDIAIHHGGVVKGIAETLKALEAQKVKAVFLADDCDNEQYKETIKALADQFNVPVVPVATWVELKDFCHLGMLSATIRQIAEEKGKEPKIKPRCSSAAIIDWGEDSEAKRFLEADLQTQKK